MSEVDLETVELSITEAEKTLAKKDALARLTKNKDFVEIILKGYFEEEASRLVLSRALPQFAVPEAQEENLKGIDAIGRLREHFRAINAMGTMAAKSIHEYQVTREEILAEELDDNE